MTIQDNTIPNINTVPEYDHLNYADYQQALIDRYHQLDAIISNCEGYAAKLCYNGIGVQQNWDRICEARKEADYFRAERERVFWEYMRSK